MDLETLDRSCHDDFHEDDRAFTVGPTSFEVLGYKLDGGGVVIAHRIVSGPDANKRLHAFFYVRTTGGKQKLKDYCQKVGGEDAFSNGSPDVSKLKGVVFNADIVRTVRRQKNPPPTTMFKDGVYYVEPAEPEDAYTTWYEIAQSTIVVANRPAKA